MAPTHIWIRIKIFGNVFQGFQEVNSLRNH